MKPSVRDWELPNNSLESYYCLSNKSDKLSQKTPTFSDTLNNQ